MKHTLLIVLSLLCYPCYAQHTRGTGHTNAKQTNFCGADAAYFASLTKSKGAHKTTSTYTPLSSFPGYAVIDCGKFRLYYEDLITTNPQEGFSDLTLGATRRNTLCNVLTYIQSVFDFSAVPAGNPIRIHVSESYATANPLPVGSTFLAKAGPNHPAGPGITNGFVFDYATTGSDPNPGDYHGDLVVNFDGITYSWTGVSWASYPFTFQDDDAAPFVNCRVDLNHILLHEMGHALGWISFLNYVGTTPGSIAGGGLYSGLDYRVTKGNVFPGYSLNKLLLGPPTSPFINPLYAADTNALNNDDLWLNDLHASDNHPVYSEPKIYVGTATGSLVCHLEDNGHSFTYQQRHSPGYHPRYIMAPSAIEGNHDRQYTKGEIQNFHNLGYNLTSAYMATSSATITNHTPYSTKMASYVYDMYSINICESMPADFTMTNNLGSSITINLLTDPTLTDADGDPISVMPGTLFNLRGCGDGGNNHNQLAVSPDGHSITYTPRPNFYGRAQFCFNLWDGKEKGSFVIYTIDVAKGTAVSTPPGTNLVLNGAFEEGTELKLLATAEGIPNADYFDGHIGCLMGQIFSDAQPYCYMGAPGDGVDGEGFSALVKNSQFACAGTTYTELAGDQVTSFPMTIAGFLRHPLAVDGSNRYKEFWGFGYTYFSLGDSVRHCHRYTLDYDYYQGEPGLTPPGTAVPFSFGFVKNPVSIPVLYSPIDIPYLDSFVTNVPGDTAWHHATIHFTYCSDTSSSVFCINNLTGSYQMMMDNISLKEDTAPAPLLVVVTDTTTGTIHKLTASTANIACGTTYSWSTGATTPTINVTPTLASHIYTVTINDGCDTGMKVVSLDLVLAVELLTANRFSIYPNPATNNFTIISTFASAEPVTMQIIDMSGREADNRQLIFSGAAQEISTDLPNGVYIIKLTDKTDHKDQQRLVICK